MVGGVWYSTYKKNKKMARKLNKIIKGDDIAIPKKSLFRKKQGKQSKVVVSKWGPLTGEPRTKFVKLKYCTTLTFNVTDDSFLYKLLRANSPNDPDYTGVGHCPLGWNEVKLFYSHYLVHNCDCKVTWTSQGGTSVDQTLAVAMYKADKSTVTNTDLQSFVEQGRTSYRCLRARECLKPEVTKLTYNCKLDNGIKDPEDNLEEYGASVGSDPNQDWYFYLMVDPNMVGNYTTNAGYIVSAFVEMTFYISMHEKKEMSPS